jgi:DNA polymerase
MSDILFGDFETQSANELTDSGVDVYSKHRTTEAVCLGAAFNNEPVSLWKYGEPLEPRIANHIKKGGILVAHNAPFELNIWNNVCVPKYGWPKLDIEQVFCTMAMANAMGLPSSLGQAAPAAGLEQVKDASAHRIMLQIAKPRTYLNGEPIFWQYKDIPEKFEHLYRYCKQDVAVERGLFYRLNPLSTKERKIWVLDQKINQRGIGIDLPLVKECSVMVDLEQKKLKQKLLEVTDGCVNSFNAHVPLRKWANARGVKTDSVDKEAVSALLKRKDIPSDVREAFEIRKAAAKSSTAKLFAMLVGCTKGRARYTFEYYGAKQTGRWAGRRLQLHNMPRPKLKQKQIEDALTRFKNPEEIEMLYGDIMQTASDCLRAFLIPSRSNKFLTADFSNIEGRCLAWLANEEWKLKAFSEFDEGVGRDLYILEYARAFGIEASEVTDDQRQIGKVITLSMGYQGGVGAFQNMAKNYGVRVSDEKADELKKAWRGANPRIVRYWYEVDDAVRDAIENKGSTYAVGVGPARVFFKVIGSFLCAKLPGGRIMYYPYPDIQKQIWVTLCDPKVKNPTQSNKGLKSRAFIGKTKALAIAEAEAYAKKKKWEMKEVGEPTDAIVYKSVDADTKQWQYTSTYGASIVENLCQAISRNVLAEALLRLDEAGYPVVLHVHDEIVSEVKDDKAFDLNTYEKLMSEVPEWATGFPIAAKGWEGKRYRKG